MAEYTVSRETTIEASRAAVHALIDDFRAWKLWSPWEDLDPDLQRTYSGAEAGVGTRYAWTGNRKAGAGSMEIIGSEPDTITVTVRFLKPFKSTSTSEFRLRAADAGTAVTWTMTGASTGMSALFSRFMNMDKLIGPDFEKGLARLKARAER